MAVNAGSSTSVHTGPAPSPSAATRRPSPAEVVGERILPPTERERFKAENPEGYAKVWQDPTRYATEALLGANGVPRARLEEFPGRFLRNAAAIPVSMVEPAARVMRETLPALGFGVPGLESAPSVDRQLEAIRNIGGVAKDFGLGLLDQVRQTVDDPLGMLASRPVDAVGLYYGARGAARGGARQLRTAAAKVPQVSAAIRRGVNSMPPPIIAFPQENMGFRKPGSAIIPETPIAKATKAGDDAVLAMGKDVPEAPLEGAAAAEAAGQSSLFDAPAAKVPETPAKPASVMVGQGDVVKSASGRDLSPAPKVDTSSSAKASNSIRRMDEWLHREALIEVAGSDYRTGIVKGMDPKKLATADREILNDILFDGLPPDRTVLPASRPLAPPSAPAVEPAAKPAKPGKEAKAFATTVKSDEVSFYSPFQNRKDLAASGKLVSEEKLQGFLRDGNGFDMDLITRDPVTVWRDTKNELGAGKDRVYALDGHHRTELAKYDWKEAKPGVWERGDVVSRDMPAVEIKGTLAEALKAAEDANRKGVPNTFSENAVRARQLLAEGSDVRQVADRLRVSTSKVKDLEDFAHLDDSLRPEISKSERAIPYGVALGRMARRYPEHFGREGQLKFWKLIEEGKGGGIRSVGELEMALEMEAATIEAMKQSDMFGGQPLGMSADLTKKALELVRAIRGEGSPEAKLRSSYRKMYGTNAEKWPPNAKKGMKDAAARSKAVAKIQKEFGPEKLRTELAVGVRDGIPVEAVMDGILGRVRERLAGKPKAAKPKNLPVMKFEHGGVEYRGDGQLVFETRRPGKRGTYPNGKPQEWFPTSREKWEAAHFEAHRRPPSDAAPKRVKVEAETPGENDIALRGIEDGRARGTTIDPAEIRVDERFQPRKDAAGPELVNEAKVSKMIERGVFKKASDAVVVWVDKAGELGAKGRTYLLDGHHRKVAAERMGQDAMPAIEYRGTLAEAEAFSAQTKKFSDAPKIERSEIPLTPEQSRVEARAIGRVRSKWSELLDDAAKRFGNLIDVDGLRELFPDYAASPEARALHAASVHESVSALGKARFRELVDAPPSGPNAYGVFLGGGAGAGKSTALRQFPEGLAANADLVVDGTLTHIGKATAQIDRVVASGRKVEVVYVLTDPSKAFVGTLRRSANAKSETPGRAVPVQATATGHAAAADVAIGLLERYDTNPNVSVKVFERTGGDTKEIGVDRAKAIQSELKGVDLEKAFREELENEYAAGNVPDYIYRATAGKEPPRQGVHGRVRPPAGSGSSALPDDGRQGRAPPAVAAPPAPPRKPPVRRKTASPPPPPPPPKKPSLVVRGLNKTAGALEALDRAADPGRALTSAFNALRARSATVDALGVHVGEHLIRRAEQLEARRIYGKGEAKFFRDRDREASEIAKATKALTKDEKRGFYRYVTGLEGLPANAPDHVRKALDWWREKNAQEQRRLIDLGLLDEGVGKRRAYQPMRMERWGPESEANLQQLRREAESQGIMDSQAARILDKRTARLEKKLIEQGREAPVYFPMLRSVRPSDFLPSRMLQRKKHSQMKLSTGKRLASGEFEHDPAPVMAKTVNERLKLESIEKTIQEIMDSPTIRKRVYKKGEILGPDEALFAPDGFLKFYRRTVDFSDEVAAVVKRVGSVDEALAEALHKAIAAGEFSDTSVGVGRAKVWVMPKKVVDELRAQTVPVPRWIRLAYDRPIDYWRTAVLPLRPAWLVNNLIGDAIFATLAGTSPRHYALALREKYRAAMPEELTQGGMVREANTIHLGRSQDTLVGQALTFIENAPGPRHIGQLADRMKAANEATDNFFRRAAYVRQAEKIARAKHMKRVAAGFHDAFDLVRAIDSLTPAEAAAALKRVNHFMGDYIGGMAPWERQWLRRIVPFYAFMKHQTRLIATLPKEAPGKTLMMSQLAQVGEDLNAESEERLPEYLRNKGLIDLQLEFQVNYGGRDRRVRVYLASQGWNPLILGFSPSGEVRGLTTDPRELLDTAASQTNPIVQYGVSALTKKNTLGRPFTEPGTFEERGRFYRSVDDLKGYPEDRIIKREGMWAEVKSPVPNLFESYAGAFPQTTLARRMVRPEAGYTAEPFSVESSAGGRSSLVRTRLTEALRYFSGGSFMLLDVESGRPMPISRSTLRSLMRKRAQEKARKAQ